METPIAAYSPPATDHKTPVVSAEAIAPSPTSSSSDAPAALHVPTVDIGPYLADPTSPAAAAVVSTVREACQSHGFFQITQHGIPRALQAAVFAGARAFFALPFATKEALDAKRVRGHRGYDVLASQSYEAGVAPDLKEGFYVGADMPESHPRVQAERFFAGANVWPDSSALPPEDFRHPAERYHAALSALSVRVLQLVADTLPFGSDVFEEFVGNDPIAPMRMLHYPPARPQEDGKVQYGASAHTDFGAITLLLQDESPGLEVWDAQAERWVGVAPNPDAYVVNVGDMLSAWTGGRYVSSVHRVINSNPWDRYSVVFFFDGNPDTELRALDGSEDGKEGVETVEQHMVRRMAESYGKGAKKE